MASKTIPKYRKESLEFWSKEKLTLHIGGTYIDSIDHVKYFIYPETISESSNTIISQIYNALMEIERQQLVKKMIIFVFDNHSTQKNCYVVSYLEFLARNQYFSDPEGFFHIIYLVRGHTHNHLDAANSKVRQKYFAKESIISMKEFISVVDSVGPKYSAEFAHPLFKFKEWLAPNISKSAKTLLTINKVHQIKITAQGIYTKLFNEEQFSTWRGRAQSTGQDKEPFFLLHSFPIESPEILKSTAPSAEKKASLISSFGSLEIVDRVFSEFLALPNVQFQHLIPALTSETDPDNQTEIIQASQVEEQEWIVTDITSRRYNKLKKRYEWKTIWEGGEITWEPKENFIDASGAINDIFSQYELVHPLRKRVTK